MKLATLIVISSLTVMTSCKPTEDGTSLSSIDNLAAKKGSYRLNNCSGSSLSKKNSFQVDFKKHISGSEALYRQVKSDIQEVVSIVPEPIAKAFFVKGHKIHLSSGSPKVCSKISQSDIVKHAGKEQSEGSRFSCWFADSKSSGVALGSGILNGQGISLQQAIKHSLLRSIISFYSFAIVPNLGSELAQGSGYASVLSKVDGVRNVLAGSLLNDAAQNEISDMSFLQSMDKATLGHYALIESIDSVLCSNRTLNVFRSCFPSTYSSFGSNKPASTQVDLSACKAAL